METKTDTKSKIIYAAMKLFPKMGYEKTSMRSIAEEVGITKPALYYYYKNKEELFKSIVDFGNSYSLKKLIKIRNEDAPFRTKLKNLVWIKFAFMHESEDVRRFSSWLTTDGMKYLIKSDLDKELSVQMDIIYEIMAKAKQNGDVRQDLDVEAFIFLLFGAANVYIKRYELLGKEILTEEKVNNLIDTLMRDATV